MNEPPQNSHDSPKDETNARHGPERRPAAAEAVSDDELQRVVRRYPSIGNVEKRVRGMGGLRNTGVVFETKAGRFLLKKHLESLHRREDVLWRHRVISHLVARDFPTPALVENETGETLTEQDDVRYELFEAPRGEDIYDNYESWVPFSRRDHARSAGEMLARFHQELSDFPVSDVTPVGNLPDAPMSARYDLGFTPDLIAAIEKRISASPALEQFFADIRWKRELSWLYLSFHGETRRYMSGVQPWVTHGRWEARNLLFEHDRVSSVLGFDFADVSFRMYDLAGAVDRNAIQWTEIADGRPNAVRFDVVEELIRGYCSLLPISMVEAELLGALLPIHHLDWALSNIEYALVHEASQERAEWFYYVYLRDHVRHYHTPSGQKILTFLRHAAAAG